MPRLRVGIDRPTSKDHDVVADYVMDKFNPEQIQILREAMDPAIKLLFKHVRKNTGVDILRCVMQQETCTG